MRHFKLKVYLLLSFLLVNFIGIALIFGQAEFFFTQIVLFSLSILFIQLIFRLVNQTNQSLNRFLFALKYNDFSIHFSENQAHSFKALHQALNRSLTELKKVEENSNVKTQWLNKALLKAPIAIIVLEENHRVLFSNDRTLDILDLPQIHHLNQLDRLKSGLTKQLIDMPFDTPSQLQLIDGKDLLVHKVSYKDSGTYEFFYIQAVEQNSDIELEAWSNLIRVMTHEIMNSITSISSLASTIKESSFSNQLPEDIQIAAKRIENRSQSLIEFTNNYRTINQVKVAQKTWFNLKKVIEDQKSLLNKQLGVTEVLIEGDCELNLYADKSQIEQVIINLFLNAIDALKGRSSPQIQIRLKSIRKNLEISFSDNGQGIPPSIQNDIFIPFFSSKKEGKGIGLSLCRKLMRNNGGSISLYESKENYTEFKLRFSLTE